MTYRVMQATEDRREFCAAGDFASWEAAEQWIDANESNWPESRFWVEAEAAYNPDCEELDDIPW
jgi:hypothetical protein